MVDVSAKRSKAPGAGGTGGIAAAEDYDGGGECRWEGVAAALTADTYIFLLCFMDQPARPWRPGLAPRV